MLVRLFCTCITTFCSIFWTASAACGQESNKSSASARIEEARAEATKLFREQIAPILAARCISCHGVKQEGGYSVATPAKLFVAGDSEAKPIFENDLNKSEFWRRLVTEDTSERMPEDAAPLTKEQLAAFRTWIESGAPVEPSDQQRSMSAIAIAKVVMAPEHYPRPMAINALATSNLRISNDAETIWVGGYAELTQWRAITGKLLARVPVAGPNVSAIALLADGKSLVASSGSPGQRGVVEWIELSDLNVRRVALEATLDVAADLAVTNDGQRVAIGHQDGSLQIVELLSDHRFGQIETMTPHADAILALAWNSDVKRLITASRDRTAKLFSGTPMELIASYDRHERAVGGVSFLGKRPLSLDETGRLRMMEGDDSDGVVAEQSGLPRVLQRFVTANDKIFIADRNRLREFRIETKTVEDGKDDEGKPKTKKITKFREGTMLAVDAQEWITSLTVTESAIVVGTQQGKITVWDRSTNKQISEFLAKP